MKKLFISADIEGTSGIAAWQETNHGNDYSSYFLTQMSRECAAAAQGALDAGFGETVIKDAHDSARNIIPSYLPRQAKLLRGWTEDPMCMMAGLDSSFSAAICTGYHAPAHSGGSPLCHTMTTSVYSVELNGAFVSEFELNALTAAYVGVPVIMITGDAYVCSVARKLIPAITAVPVCEGVGGASLSINPDLAVELIHDAAVKAASGDISRCFAALPGSFEMKVTYKRCEDAYRNSFFPGAKAEGANTVVFRADDYKALLAFEHFCL